MWTAYESTMHKILKLVNQNESKCSHLWTFTNYQL